MTKLTAVNLMLKAMGNPPATALNTGGTSDVAEAETFLDDENRRIQAMGWYQNTLIDQTFTESGGAIALTDVLAIVRNPAKGGTLPLINYTIRNGSLYNLDDNTATFTDDVVLSVVKLLTFTDLTEQLATYIATSAAQQFARYKKRGQFDEAILSQRLNETRAAAQRENTEMGQISIHRTPEINGMTGWRYPITASG